MASGHFGLDPFIVSILVGLTVMMLPTKKMLPLVFTLATLIGGVTATLPRDCSRQSFDIPGVKIQKVEHVRSGVNIPLPDTVESCGGSSYSANITTDLCRVVANVPTSNSSSISLEAWLPDDWNDRFLATGNGGIGGCVDYDLVQNGAQLGFAAVGTNGGHDGAEGFDFFLNHPEVINDFGHRALHAEAQAGKKIVDHYYSQDFKSYYWGCSTGGRQGIQTAQMYPGNFDGVLVGAPGLDWLRVVSSKPILARRIGWPHLNASNYVRPEQWAAIVEKQVEMFDELDGVKDGIIDYPSDYKFDPEVLACGTGALNSSACLTPGQVRSVRLAYEPIIDSEGHFAYPAFNLGADTGVFSENQADGKPELSYTTLDDYFKGAIFNDSTWSSVEWKNSDMDYALSLNPGGIAFADKDLSEFEAGGGKLLAYHGFSDETVTTQLSMEYFAGVQKALNFTTDEMHSFYRLFTIPGMHHCSTGPGAWNIGQTYPMDAKQLDSSHHALLALADWVENGKAPDEIIGTKYANDDTAAKITAQRTHCPYPYRSVWDGDDSNEATSWKCKMPLS